MSNSTIVAIAVHQKLNIGDRFWYVDFGDVREVTITTKLCWRPYRILAGGDWWLKYTDASGNVYEDNPGDMGVPGFAYDDRPCKLVKGTKDDAAARSKEYLQWFASSDRDDSTTFQVDYDDVDHYL